MMPEYQTEYTSQWPRAVLPAPSPRADDYGRSQSALPTVFARLSQALHERRLALTETEPHARLAALESLQALIHTELRDARLAETFGQPVDVSIRRQHVEAWLKEKRADPGLRMLLMKHLTTRKVEMLIFHYGLGKQTCQTFGEIGVRLGMSRERVRQTVLVSLEKLSHLVDEGGFTTPASPPAAPDQSCTDPAPSASR